MREEKSMSYYFGVDIGGTTVKLGFFDAEGTLIERSGFRNVILYGVAFYKKECLVKKA